MKKILVIISLVLSICVLMSACATTDPIETTNPIDVPKVTQTPQVTQEPQIVEQDPIEEPIVELEPTIEVEPIIFSPDITFTSEYIADGEFINYVLYTPSTAPQDEPVPLIVWLHGSGEKWTGETQFMSSGLPAIMSNWTLEGFNAYIVCPHLTGNFGYVYWGADFCETNLRNLIDKIVSSHNIDTNKIYVVGVSLGGAGAQYMAHELRDVFSKCVVLSGYPTTIDISNITIPTIGYVGMVIYGEDGDSVIYMKNRFATVFGAENVFELPASHGNLPTAVFNEDKDGNNRSDVIEWLFTDINPEDLK